MKRNLLLVLAIFAVNTIFAQQMWEKIYHGKRLTGMTVLPGESYVLAGSTFDNNASRWDMVQADSQGDIIWDSTFYKTERFFAEIKVTPDSGYITAGFDQTYVYITKFNANSKLEWESSVSFPQGTLTSLNSVYCLPNGEFLIAGEQGNAAFYGKLSPNGTTIWIKHMLSSDYGRGSVILEAFDSGYTGLFSTGYGGTLFAHISEQGDTSNFRVIDQQYTPRTAIATSDSCYLITAAYMHKNSRFIKIDRYGNILWVKENIGTKAYSYCTSLKEISDGNYVTLNGFYSSPQDMVISVLKLSKAGDSLTSFTTQAKLQPGRIFETPDGYYALNANDVNKVPRLIKTDSTGSVITGITNNALENKELSCYPNPFTDEITVVIPKNAGEGELISICDMQGSLVKQKQINSSGSISLKTGNMKPGIYFLELTNDDVRYIQKIVKL